MPRLDILSSKKNWDWTPPSQKESTPEALINRIVKPIEGYLPETQYAPEEGSFYDQNRVVKIGATNGSATASPQMTDLPPGFVLDPPSAQANAGTSGLPPGFVLDNEQSAPSIAPPHKFGLADTWPAKLAKGVYSTVKSAVTLPGDVYAGRVDPGSDEAIKRSMDLATVGTPVSPAARIGVGWAGVPKSLTPGQEAVIAADRIGVDLPRAAASDSITTQRVGQALSNVPIGGSSLRKAGETATKQLGEAADTAAAMPTGATVSAEQAGNVARKQLENYVGPVISSRADKLYTQVGSVVDQTVKAPLSNTAKVAQEIISKRSNAAIPGDSGAVKQVMDAATAPGGLNYQGIKDLRSSVGEMLNGGILPSDISQSELKRIYGALSDDLANVVSVAGGPKAKSLFDRANNYYKLASDRRENLMRVLNVKSDEGIFGKIAQLAGSTNSADANLLSQARKAIPSDEWSNVASAAVSRLGRDKAGDFSAARFVSDFNQISQRGKSILFGSESKLLPYLNDIAKVSERAKLWQKYANPSGTAQNLIGTGQIAGFGAAGYAALGGSYVEPLTAIGSVVGTTLLSRALAQPAKAAAIAQWSRAYEVAVMRPGTSTLAALNIASRNLANNLSDRIAGSFNPTDFMRAIQGPIPARPNENQNNAPPGLNK